jgi:hypothetical protein
MDAASAAARRGMPVPCRPHNFVEVAVARSPSEYAVAESGFRYQTGWIAIPSAGRIEWHGVPAHTLYNVDHVPY